MYAFQVEPQNGNKEHHTEVRGFETLEQADEFILWVQERLNAAVDASQLTGFWIGEPYRVHTFGKVLAPVPDLEEVVDEMVKSVG